MATTTNLLATHVEQSQSNKEVTINEGFTIFDKGIAGSLSKSITTADVTLTDDEARNAIINLSGTLTGNRNLIVPARSKLYLVSNNTSGGFTVTVKTASGTGVAVTQGTRAFLYCDGTNVYSAGVSGGSSSSLTAPPVLSSWTWVNQGGATAADSSSIFVGSTKVTGISFVAPAGSGDNVRILKKSAPSTPYTVIMAFSWLQRHANFCRAGFCWRQSSDGKLVMAASIYSSNPYLDIAKWSSPTSFSATYTQHLSISGYALVWLKLQDDGTNRIVSGSADGVGWVQLHSVGRTDFMTADEVGFCMNMNNSTLGSSMSLVHWEELAS
jgi:hypothetical protein